MQYYFNVKFVGFIPPLRASAINSATVLHITLQISKGQSATEAKVIERHAASPSA